ncbi:MAG: CmcJ/NvfI family oxidoreductase [Pseudomonadota bacterium]|nr:CmcJ/NvfI family oxidoreductase [Pseudomonadota bacterium]
MTLVAERQAAAPVADRSVKAEIVYTPIDGARHQVFIPDMGSGGQTRRSHPDRKMRVTIHDGRREIDRHTVDRTGFALLTAPSAVRNFYDSDEVERVYYPELERLLKAQTGASRVRIFDHTLRIDDGGRSAAQSTRMPVRRAHVDYTEKSGPQRVRDLMGDEAEALLTRRVAEINVWRPVNGTVETSPLAVVEAGTLAPGDLIATDLVYSDRVGEIYETAWNPDHRWVWFPDMTPDEVLLLKSYDSARDGRARFTPHTAFDDPASGPHSAPRESIEVRAFLFFDEPA